MSALELAAAPVGFDRDIFLRRMLRELTGLLQDVVGLEDAAGYVGSVGAAMGRWMDTSYRDALSVHTLTPRQVAEVFVDLKDRLGGEFRVVDLNAERIVLANSRCPFGEMVRGRPSLCMMTSSVFGRIAADNLGYARVILEKAIARGDASCRVVVDLRPGQGRSTAGTVGHEYYSLSSSSNAGI